LGSLWHTVHLRRNCIRKDWIIEVFYWFFIWGWIMTLKTEEMVGMMQNNCDKGPSIALVSQSTICQ
jgi:hypothetical protein